MSFERLKVSLDVDCRDLCSCFAVTTTFALQSSHKPTLQICSQLTTAFTNAWSINGASSFARSTPWCVPFRDSSNIPRRGSIILFVRGSFVPTRGVCFPQWVQSGCKICVAVVTERLVLSLRTFCTQGTSISHCINMEIRDGRAVLGAIWYT